MHLWYTVWVEFCSLFRLNNYTSLLITKYMTKCVFFYFENPVWRLQVTFSTGGKKLHWQCVAAAKFEDCDILAFLCESAVSGLSESICGFPSCRLLFYSPGLDCGRSGVCWGGGAMALPNTFRASTGEKKKCTFVNQKHNFSLFKFVFLHVQLLSRRKDDI